VLSFFGEMPITWIFWENSGKTMMIFLIAQQKRYADYTKKNSASQERFWEFSRLMNF
jgi:hypothetical protein